MIRITSDTVTNSNSSPVLLGAVAGLADQPLQNLMSRSETDGQRSATSELVSGVGKGLVGVFTKPIGGAAEFISQTGQGWYQKY